MDDFPNLIEAEAAAFLQNSLLRSHDFRLRYNNQLMNIIIMAGLVAFVSIVVCYKYRGRLTEAEVREKHLAKQQYVAQKLHQFQEARQAASNSMITGLPTWNTT